MMTRSLPFGTKRKERVLRHVRWRSTIHLLGNQWAAFPRFIWTFIILLLALFALKVDIRALEGVGASLTRFFWFVAVVGFVLWMVDLAQEYPALGWTGYYMGWLALAGIILSVPDMTYVGYALLMVGIVLAALDMPSRVGFSAMGIWGMLVGIAVEHFCLEPLLPGRSSVGVLVYALLAVLLLYCLGFLESLFRGGFADDLTGVGSRQLLKWLHSSLWHVAERKERPISLLLLDIDDFKGINDRLGHAFGDATLQRFAKLIENEIRPEDILCRYGGDEFVVILKDTTNAEAVTIAHRLRRRVSEAFRRELPDNPITVSIGVASFPEHSNSLEGLINQADKALIAGAKLLGKNKVANAANLYHPDLWEMLRGQLSSDVLPLLELVSLVTGETVDHMTRLADLGTRLGEFLGLSEEQCTTIMQAAALHDVGKIAIPKGILEKPGPLTWEERQIMMTHSELGATMLTNLGVEASVVEAVRHHHEWWDGTGYPDGLREDQIPLEATVLAVVDAYDGMTSPRPYQAVRTPEQALQEIHEYSGIQFNPRAVDILPQFLEGDAVREVAAQTFDI
ncbi:MAG: diguanylate cyclase [Firmicutes bacterium]|nr:diguanylate cyclase [Bacillota bacterium]